MAVPTTKFATNTTYPTSFTIPIHSLVYLAYPSTGKISVVNSTAVKPLGITISEVDTESGLVSVQLLGTDVGYTVTGLSGSSLTVGTPVFSGLYGKVYSQPATAGTYYQVGFAVSAADADEEVQLVSCVPHPVVVS